MIKAGKLNKRITILKVDGITNNTLGQGVLKFQPFKTVWAEVAPLSGREFLDSQIVRAETTYRIKIRYTQGITPDMKIEYKGRKFDIISILNIEEHNVELQLMCTEQYPAKG